MKGKLFAISGPSGVGKNSVLNRVMQLRDRVQYSVSATSRPMRPGEIDGKSYYFVTREQFEQMIAAGELLEHAEYVGNYYGTPLKPIQAALAAGTDVVMDVDVVGALNIKKAPAGGGSGLHGRTVDGRDPPQARCARRCFAGADGKADGPGKMGIRPGWTIRLSRRQRYGRARGAGAACDHDRRKV